MRPSDFSIGTRKRLLAAVVTAAATFALAAPAQAGVLVSSASSCDEQTFEQPFLPWGDVANYVMSPGGTFEPGAPDWDLAGGASVVHGNEPYYVHGSRETRSLRLSGAAAATSPAMCVGIEHPTVRLFVRNSGALTATLQVEVLFEDAGGEVRSLTIGQLAGDATWRPSVPLAIVVNLLPLLPGEKTAVAFRVSSEDDGGSWRVDDFYVDPYRSR